MRILKKSMSIPLSLIMVFSVFTVVPFTTSAQESVRYIKRYSSWFNPTVVTTSVNDYDPAGRMMQMDAVMLVRL